MLGDGRFSSGIVIHGCLRISSSVGLSHARTERHLWIRSLHSEREDI